MKKTSGSRVTDPSVTREKQSGPYFTTLLGYQKLERRGLLGLTPFLKFKGELVNGKPVNKKVDIINKKVKMVVFNFSSEPKKRCLKFT